MPTPFRHSIFRPNKMSAEYTERTGAHGDCNLVDRVVRIVETQHGIAVATSLLYFYDRELDITIVDFIHGGRKHRRVWQRYFGSSRLVSLARKMVDEVVAGQQ